MIEEGRGASLEEVIQEARENLRRDRTVLEDFRKKLVEAESGDSILYLAENVSRLSDSLSRVNAQLVELAKLLARRDRPTAPGNKGDDSLFDEIDARGTFQS